MKKRLLLWTATLLLGMTANNCFAEDVAPIPCDTVIFESISTSDSTVCDTTITYFITPHILVLKEANPDIAFTENGVSYDFVSETDVIVVSPTITRLPQVEEEIIITTVCCTTITAVTSMMPTVIDYCSDITPDTISIDTTHYEIINIVCTEWQDTIPQTPLICSFLEQLPLDNGLTYDYVKSCTFSYNPYEESIVIPTKVRGYNVLGIVPEALLSFSPDNSVSNWNPVPQAFAHNYGVSFPEVKPTLYVPEESATAYRNAPLWQEFDVVGVIGLFCDSIVNHISIIEMEVCDTTVTLQNDTVFYHILERTEANPQIAFTEDGISYDFVAGNNVVIVPPTRTYPEQNFITITPITVTTICCTTTIINITEIIDCMMNISVFLDTVMQLDCQTTIDEPPVVYYDTMLAPPAPLTITFNNGQTYQYDRPMYFTYDSYDQDFTIPTQVGDYNVLGIVPEVLYAYRPEYSITNLHTVPQEFEYDGGPLFPDSKPNLYVPAASVAAYEAAAVWQEFNIQSILTTGAGNAAAAPPAVVGYYSVLGVQLPQAPESGIYIILYDNGKAEKIVR